jgi:hypothetical protein
LSGNDTCDWNLNERIEAEVQIQASMVGLFGRPDEAVQLDEVEGGIALRIEPTYKWVGRQINFWPFRPICRFWPTFSGSHDPSLVQS